MINNGFSCFQGATGRNKEKRHHQDRAVAAVPGGRVAQSQMVIDFDLQLIKRFLQNNFFTALDKNHE